MEFFGRRGTGIVVVALVAVGAWASSVSAQESFDPSQLDANGAVKQAKAKAKKAMIGKPATTPPAPGKGGKPGGDRQFGELEGWSPGKTPAAAGKKNDAADPGSDTKAPPVSLSPSGQPSLGLTF